MLIVVSAGDLANSRNHRQPASTAAPCLLPLKEQLQRLLVFHPRKFGSNRSRAAQCSRYEHVSWL